MTMPASEDFEEIGLTRPAANCCRHGRSLPKSAHRAGVSAFFTGIGPNKSFKPTR